MKLWYGTRMLLEGMWSQDYHIFAFFGHKIARYTVYKAIKNESE